MTEISDSAPECHLVASASRVAKVAGSLTELGMLNHRLMSAGWCSVAAHRVASVRLLCQVMGAVGLPSPSKDERLKPPSSSSCVSTTTIDGGRFAVSAPLTVAYQLDIEPWYGAFRSHGVRQ